MYVCIYDDNNNNNNKDDEFKIISCYIHSSLKERCSTKRYLIKITFYLVTINLLNIKAICCDCNWVFHLYRKLWYSYRSYRHNCTLVKRYITNCCNIWKRYLQVVPTFLSFSREWAFVYVRSLIKSNCSSQ